MLVLFLLFTPSGLYKSGSLLSQLWRYACCTLFSVIVEIKRIERWVHLANRFVVTMTLSLICERKRLEIVK